MHHLIAPPCAQALALLTVSSKSLDHPCSSANLGCISLEHLGSSFQYLDSSFHIQQKDQNATARIEHNDIAFTIQGEEEHKCGKSSIDDRCSSGSNSDGLLRSRSVILGIYGTKGNRDARSKDQRAGRMDPARSTSPSS